VDAFAWIVAGGLGALIVALVLIGRYYPGTGADVLDWKPARSLEAEAELEAEDVQQMLDAQNERRRARGEGERTLDDLEGDIAVGMREQARLRAAYQSEQRSPEERALDDEDLRQLLAARNERRRRRGEPEIGEQEFLDNETEADRPR
jgi:hypothetical protein